MRALTTSFLSEAQKLQENTSGILKNLKKVLSATDIYTLNRVISTHIAEINKARGELSRQIKRVEKDIWRKERLDRVLESELRILERIIEILQSARNAKTITREQAKEIFENCDAFVVGADEVNRRFKYIKDGITSPV